MTLGTLEPMGESVYPVTQQGKQGRQKFGGWNPNKYRVLLGLSKGELPVDNQEGGAKESVGPTSGV